MTLNELAGRFFQIRAQIREEAVSYPEIEMYLDISRVILIKSPPQKCVIYTLRTTSDIFSKSFSFSARTLRVSRERETSHDTLFTQPARPCSQSAVKRRERIENTACINGPSHLTFAMCEKLKSNKLKRLSNERTLRTYVYDVLPYSIN